MDPLDPLTLLIVFAITVSISTVILWMAMRLTKVQGKFVHLFLACAISGLIRLIPFAGFILSFIALVWLISFWTDAEVYPDAVLMVVVAQGIGLIVSIYLTGLLAQ